MLGFPAQFAPNCSIYLLTLSVPVLNLLPEVMQNAAFTRGSDTCVFTSKEKSLRSHLWVTKQVFKSTLGLYVQNLQPLNIQKVEPVERPIRVSDCDVWIASVSKHGSENRLKMDHGGQMNSCKTKFFTYGNRKSDVNVALEVKGHLWVVVLFGFKFWKCY